MVECMVKHTLSQARGQHMLHAKGMCENLTRSLSLSSRRIAQLPFLEIQEFEITAFKRYTTFSGIIRL